MFLLHQSEGTNILRMLSVLTSFLSITMSIKQRCNIVLVIIYFVLLYFKFLIYSFFALYSDLFLYLLLQIRGNSACGCKVSD